MKQDERKKITISIKHCNNISIADFDLYRNELNIRYALNGTGKSTLSKAIDSFVSDKDIAFLKPFGSKDDSSVKISDKLNKVLIFNEDFVNNIVFNESEVIKNGFEVFLKGDEYDKKAESLSQKIKSLKIGIEENEDFKILKEAFSSIEQKLKLNKDEATLRKDTVKQSILSKENFFKIPPELTIFQPFFENTDIRINWIDWKNAGGKYDEISGCPFCTKKLGGDYQKQKEILEKSYKKNMVKHLSSLLDSFGSLECFLDKDKYDLIVNCIKEELDEGAIEQVVTKLMVEIRDLFRRMKGIVQFNNFNIDPKEISKIGKLLEGHRINIDSIDYFKSERAIKLFNEINSKLDDVNKIVVELKKEMGDFFGFIRGTVTKHKNNINDFLRVAGINYELEIITEGANNIKTILCYVNRENKKIDVDRITDHLSWGEKNAFALILFMYYAISHKPDLIILDDPVSSFDKNKKYAIINYLFSSSKTDRRESLYRKTVLMLSHDFEPIIDFIVTKKPTGEYVNAEYFRNVRGEILHFPIEQSAVKSWIFLLRKYSQCSDLCIINRLAFLRKYIDLHKASEEENLAYGIISSLQHGYPSPKTPSKENLKESLIVMTEDKIKIGVKYLKKFISDFSYQGILSEIDTEEKVLRFYKEQPNSYLKLQIFRTFRERMHSQGVPLDKSTTKYIDETYHIENDYIYFLDLLKYELVPDHIINSCDEYIDKYEK